MNKNNSHSNHWRTGEKGGGLHIEVARPRFGFPRISKKFMSSIHRTRAKLIVPE